ncbi:MAG: nuclear transport factor 2 family protein [FCB group bacterium]|nr:nuclear transport factor 2 family protein [FCB group bacterium]
MKNYHKLLQSITLLAVLFWGSVYAGDSSDEKMIRQVVTQAYVDGLQNWGDLEKTKKGFDPTFQLLIKGKNNRLQRYAIADWIENISRKKKNFPDGPDQRTTVKFIFVDITGDAAVSKIVLFQSEKPVYTDYLSLYRFQDGWRIVSKIYFRHQ